MKISIQRFLFSLVLIFLIIFLSIIAYAYLFQQEKTANVIFKSLTSEISEINYIISKNMTMRKDVLLDRPLLDRIAVNNDFIEAIMVHDGHKILLSTDPLHTKILSNSTLFNGEKNIYDKLVHTQAIESTVRFFIGDKIETLQLAFVLDQHEIKMLFDAKKVDFLLLFTIVPLCVVALIWILIGRYIVKPLERLRQFAYYQNDIPKAFNVKELEVIRYSMVETFDRLENEKKELYAVARTDSLSGLANRNALIEYLTRLIANYKREKREFAMLFLDLDHFKSVNDSLGHNVGDALLAQVATVIDNVLRSDDFVARVGGDEFVIILQNYSSMHELTNIIDRIQWTLSQTLIVQTNPINISSSVGIAFFPKDGDNIVSLMQNSDIAMYEAKQNGRSQYHFFTEKLNKRVQDTIRLEIDMKEALLNDEYELYYQPKVDILSGKIVAAEALVRWISPTKGIIPPSDFIPLAEENGFIVELGDWILRTAIQQQVAFEKAGIEIKISINLSSKQLLLDNFMEIFSSYMTAYNAKANLIDIEITEYMFYEKNDKNMKVLQSLHEYGVTISLDDFGTGYSSLSYLKDFPIDYLKIDKSFLDDYKQERGRVFIDTIVKMGQTLNMQIIAEGVESKDQVEYLKGIGCDQFQGYYTSKPLCVKDFKQFIGRY